MICTTRKQARTGRWPVSFMAAGLLIACSAGAAEEPSEQPVTQPAEDASTEPRQLGDDWAERIEEVDGNLKAGRWEAAGEAADEVALEMVEILVSQPGADRALGSISAYRALASAGQGRTHEALWRWAMAQNLYTPFKEADLSDYGEAGELLNRHRLREIGDRVEGLHSMAEITEPPALSEASPPFYPAGAKLLEVAGDVLIDAVVGTNGRLQDPVVRQSPGSPPLVYAALEAMTEWKLEPARKDGEPVAMMRTFRVVFEPEDEED